MRLFTRIHGDRGGSVLQCIQKSLIWILVGILPTIGLVGAAYGLEGMAKWPSTPISVNYFPSQPRTFTFPKEAGRYYSIIISGSMLRSYIHRGKRYQSRHNDACFNWEKGDRAGNNNDATDPRPWMRGPWVTEPASFTNNLGVGLCDGGYDSSHIYWSGWFLSNDDTPLQVTHNLAADPKNQGSFHITLGAAPSGVNPIGVWEYRNGNWVDLRTTRQSSGGMRANPSNIVTVPALDGMTMERARDALSHLAGLMPDFVGGNPAPDKASQYTVQSQSPPPGTRVPEGTEIRVWLYGPFAPGNQASAAAIPVPDVVGLTSARANHSITKAGLAVQIQTGPAAPVAAKNKTVQTQTPAPGQKLPPNGTVTLIVYSDAKGPATAGDICKKNYADFLHAMIANDYPSARKILSHSKNCKFYRKELADLRESECRSRAIQILEAKQKHDYAQARAVLADSRDCDFYNRYAQELECSENLYAMMAAANAGNISEYRSILSRSRHCSYYADLKADLRKAEQQAAQQNLRNRQLAQAVGQVLGGVIRDMAASSGSSGQNPSSGGSSGPPVVQHSSCDDVRKAGSNRPERHIVDLGSGSGSFVFEFQTYTEEDRITVSQGSRVLFNSGCIGTRGRRAVRLTKGFGSEITVEVSPNCNGGTNTQWEFMVHCPQ